MAKRSSQPELPEFSQALVQLPVAVDLIRFEKNLLQIGFFGAHDTRHNQSSTRRIEQWVVREGQKTRVSAEFRGSAALGLPSTSDRDKYIAFMRIAMDQRVQLGRLENPIRFTGYQMLKELGMTYSGENYEDINRWGQRMADTSITSEQVIYLAARKRYANKTIHVFRSFVRAGKSALDDSSRTECYEVVLEDWLLENLNQSYVIPEDFNAYRCLKRPTAKGIFGYLHLWFHASHGRTVEKDYTELCMLLNIPVYRHLSKIRETMGRSLDELGEIGYLSHWDIRPMVTKPGFKLVLQAGEKLLHVLAVSQRKSLGAQQEPAPTPAAADTASVLNLLKQWGVTEAKAAALVRGWEAPALTELVEYAGHLVKREGRKIGNPAGFLIYAIESRLPVPADFTLARAAQAKEAEQTQTAQNAQSAAASRPDLSYVEYVERQLDEELAARFPGAALEKRIQKTISNQVRGDAQFRAMAPAAQQTLAREALRQEIRESGVLLSFEQWCESAVQMNLFAGRPASDLETC